MAALVLKQLDPNNFMVEETMCKVKKVALELLKLLIF
jgi:hypothetical protein